MVIEDLKVELEKIISNLTASGFDNIDSGILEKLEEYALTAGELGMYEGKRLIENLVGVMKAIQEGKSQADSGQVRLTALNFYLINLSGGEQTEDL